VAVSDGAFLDALTGHSDSIQSVALSPDGAWLATAGWDNHLIIWDMTTGRPNIA